MNNEEIEPIECRAAVEISPTTTNEILFLPVGLHAITPVSGGIGRPIKVKVDQASALAIQKQLGLLMSRHKRPYFDFNHEDGPASFWPEDFIWRSGEGIIAKGEWSRRGKTAVEGKDFRAFSPVFHVDNKRNDPAIVVCKETADPNMGGLVNNPAFDNLPLWAKNAGQSSNTPEQPAITSAPAETNGEIEEMTAEEIAALRAKQQELETKVEGLSALVSKDTEDGKDTSTLETAEAELRATAAELKAAESQAKIDEQSKIISKRNKLDAEAAVKAAILRGAILPKDVRTQSELIARATADPSFIEVINRMQGKGTALHDRITASSSRVTVTDDEPVRIYGAMAKVLSLSKRTGQHSEKSALSKEFAAIYAREIGGSNSKRMLSFPVSELEQAIQAADVTDA